MAAVMDHEPMEVELDCVSGVVTLVGSYVPPVTSWDPEVLTVIRRGGSMWCSIVGGVIEMRIQPETLWYRLIGETDLTGGHVAVRCNADGSDHADAE